MPSFLSSPGGPYLYDANGRVVLLHGMNVVYKHAPYIAYPDPGKPWNFSAADAARMQSLGFNVVRLGIEWQALEPGSGGPNQPKVCTPGAPGQRARVQPGGGRALPGARGRHGQPARPLRDLHPPRHAPGRLQPELPRRGGAELGRVHRQRADRARAAAGGRTTTRIPSCRRRSQHFWANDVVGNLQGNFDLVWATVADYFKNDRWVVGYDPFNEPFSTETQAASESTFTGQLECFYTGKAHTGFLANGATPLVCPSGRARQRRDPDDPGRRPHTT